MYSGVMDGNFADFFETVTFGGQNTNLTLLWKKIPALNISDFLDSPRIFLFIRWPEFGSSLSLISVKYVMCDDDVWGIRVTFKRCWLL